MTKEDFSLFFDKIEIERQRIQRLKIDDIAAYAVERRERRKERKRRYPNRARAYMSVVGSDPCVYCGQLLEYKKMTIDHIIPRMQGGTSEWDNLAPSCTHCNVRKGSVSLLYFLAEEHKHGRR